ncbi:right-handed parallel beta-helix repeat-containing protein [Rhizobium laguerreae]|uniref:right-handed parallel beta-helix repeat-containing protein n=1 Tax=Rhizobium laguerreae TaxID=1076926 RepID=UPI0021B146B6|nr:right-handed parallel beta-helix repeat-containing protein [Rhizobium laguerreae]
MIRGNGAVIDGGEPYDDYREIANRLAAVQEANGRFPGIYYLADNAGLVLRNCQWVVIEDLTFEGCWPTAIYLDNCQHITLRRLHIRGSTIAIGAAGPYTRHLLIEECDWIQDLRSHGEADLAAIRKIGAVDAGLDPGDCGLWREISWDQVHGNIEDTESRVDVETDERGFDGDFFRAWTIAGYVVLRNNVILDAFNGIHFFNDASDSTVEDFCRNIVIENNWFVRIRDNAIEAEDYAWNWTVRGNRFVDCYMPFFAGDAPIRLFLHLRQSRLESASTWPRWRRPQFRPAFQVSQTARSRRPALCLQQFMDAERADQQAQPYPPVPPSKQRDRLLRRSGPVDAEGFCTFWCELAERPEAGPGRKFTRRQIFHQALARTRHTLRW